MAFAHDPPEENQWTCNFKFCKIEGTIFGTILKDQRGI